MSGAPLSRRVALAVYSSGSTAAAWQRTALEHPRPGVVMLHDAPRADLAATARDVPSSGSR